MSVYQLNNGNSIEIEHPNEHCTRAIWRDEVGKIFDIHELDAKRNQYFSPKEKRVRILAMSWSLGQFDFNDSALDRLALNLQ